MKKEECGGTASECEKEVDLFWKASQKYGGFRYKKLELPKRVGWNLWWMVLFSVLNILVSFLQGMYATSSTDLFLETSQKYGGFHYKKNYVFELPKMVGWNL